MVTLEQLTPEQQQALFEQMKAKEAQKEAEIKANRKAYNEMVDDVIPDIFVQSLRVSAMLSAFKAFTYESLKALIELKAEAYGREENKTHSFTTRDGVTIIIGNRYNDGWRDTVTVGIERVNNYLTNLAKDEKSGILIASVRKLLSKDSKGNLKSSRILQLKKIAEEHGAQELIEAISIIQEAYQPVQSAEFVTIRFRDANGEQVELPLDITSAKPSLKSTFEIPARYVEKAFPETATPETEAPATDNVSGAPNSN